MSDRLFRSIASQAAEALPYLGPELVITCAILLAILVDLLLRGDEKRLVAHLGVFACLLGIWGAVQTGTGTETAPSPGLPLLDHAVQADAFGTFLKIVILGATALVLWLAARYRPIAEGGTGEFYVLVLATALGAMLLMEATDLLLLYVALEFTSLASYGLAGYLKGDRASSEAGMKYLVYGGMASGTMIFGMSFLYGLAGSTRVADVSAALRAGPAAPLDPGVWPILLLVFAGFLYKIACVPFHVWAPDVYEGAPTVATAFFSVVPKAAGIAALARTVWMLFPALGPVDADWSGEALKGGQAWLAANPTFLSGISLLAVLSMTVGNLLALGQDNVKRILAYSGISHAGTMLLAVAAVPSRTAYASLLFYLLVYALMNLGAFLVVVAVENRSGGSDLGDFRGLGRERPGLAVALAIFLFGLTGLPGTAGFVGKFLIFLELAKADRYGLIFAALLNTVIALFYYVKIVKAVFLDAPEPSAPERPPLDLVPSFRVLAASLAAVTIALGLFWGTTFNFVKSMVHVQPPAYETSASR